MRRRLVTVVVLLLGLLPAPSVVVAAPVRAEASAEARDFSFSPQPITVPPGTTIVWTNTGKAPHSVTADDNSWDSGRINPGQQFSRTFDTPGTYGYYCFFHGGPSQGMFGTVVVSASAAAPQPAAAPTPAPQPPVSAPSVAAAPTTTPPTASVCTFQLGFKTLHDLIPDIVGDCVSGETHNAENGDAQQQTTHGLLVWRKADNWTAFTDGSRTWINGPNGVQDRANDERFPWEAS